MVTLIDLSFDGLLTLIKSSLIKFTTSLNIYIAGLKRPQERGNAVTALLVHSEGRIFRRRLVCNLKGEEMPGRKRVAREFEKLVKSEVKSEVCTEAGVKNQDRINSEISDLPYRKPRFLLRIL